MSDVDIFLMESFSTNGVAAVAYALFFITTTLFDRFFQTSERPLGSIAQLNAIYAVFLWQVLAITEFIIAWRSDWVGGEDTALFLLPGAAFALLLKVRKSSLAHAGVRFTYPTLIAASPLLVAFLPVVLLLWYLIALGSNWQN